MAKILVAWELGAGTGHCINLLPIVRGLLSRGHLVYAAVRDLRTARSVFNGLAVKYFQAPTQRARPIDAIENVSTFAQILHNVGFGSDEQLNTLVDAGRNLIELIQPAAVISEHSPTALLASRFYPIRRVVIGTGFFCPPDVSPLPEFVHPSTSEVSNGAVHENAICDRVNRILRSAGKPELDRLSRLYSDSDANFLLTFGELDHYPERNDTTYWGMWSPLGGVEPVWPNVPGPRIYAYLQPPAGRWHPSAALVALKKLGFPSLVYAPGIDPDLLSKFAAPNIAFESRRLDMAKVCQECDAAITHGNNGTATQLLLGRVPQLHLPLYVEQEVFRRRIFELGASLTATIDRSDQIADQLTSLLSSETYSAAAKSFAEKYRNFDQEKSMDEIVAQIDGLSNRGR